MVLGNIEKLCKARNISIARLERECGIGNATIGRWDKSSPSADNLKKVADYFGVTMDYLMSGGQKEVADGGEERST